MAHSGGNLHSRERTLATVIEAIDTEAPETKAELAETVGLSQNYLSEVLQELKHKGMVRKAYVVDDDAIFEQVEEVASRWNCEGDQFETLFACLERLNDVTLEQYQAAAAAFRGENVTESADTLEPLANERYGAVLREIKSFTITTDWPGNRISAALATIAVNFEIAGDRACLIADAVAHAEAEPTGAVHERVVDIFEAGERINGHVESVLFEGDLDAMEALHDTEKTVHRDLQELFELVTAYDPDTYGYLVTVTRTLERIIHYWVSAAETATRIHSGVDPGHVEI
ncbi:PhoU family transcriptional regulator [Halapricum salinum]|uniref:PhoU family transcriptional regulator n=1 Tax=Halapricum salinum TaxID=1457250 RepID=A0A4D6HCT1_9EURY|nr:PhoU family transcriptional regulator [Halapricum salinum]QCC50958.1 PhoU family transcriptional regulator [Halapricum salinum]